MDMREMLYRLEEEAECVFINGIIDNVPKEKLMKVMEASRYKTNSKVEDEQLSDLYDRLLEMFRRGEF